MADMQAIHKFALRWIDIFNDPEAKDPIVEEAFGNSCYDLGFKMDSGESFRKEFQEDEFLNPIAFQDIAHLIDDVDFLCCAIHSKYRLLTHWWNQNCLDPRNRVWFKYALNRLAELTDPANFIEHFEGVVQSICLDSNKISFFQAPESGHEVKQQLLLSDKGLGKLLRYNEDDLGKPASEMDLCIGSEHARKILDAIGEYFAENTPIKVTDIGTWNLVIVNTDGRKFCFDGSLNGYVGLSDLIRSELGMENLFLFDGNPDRIERFELTYRKSIKDTGEPNKESGYWYYLERLCIDRSDGLFEYSQGVGGRNSATYIFRDAQDVALLLNQIDLFPVDFELDVPEDLAEDEITKQDYKLSIHYRHTPTFEISGGYDKYGLPENWDEAMEAVWEFIHNRGYIGDILNSDVYSAGRRRASDLVFVYVRFNYSPKEYCYLAEHDIYAEGDKVVVPVGPDGNTATARVKRVEYHSADDAPYPLDKIKKIIGKVDLSKEE